MLVLYRQCNAMQCDATMQGANCRVSRCEGQREQAKFCTASGSRKAIFSLAVEASISNSKLSYVGRASIDTPTQCAGLGMEGSEWSRIRPADRQYDKPSESASVRLNVLLPSMWLHMLRYVELATYISSFYARILSVRSLR